MDLRDTPSASPHSRVGPLLGAAEFAWLLEAETRATPGPNGRETVAAHSFTLVLAILVCPPPWGLSAQVLAYAAVHDLAEAITGDVDTSDWTPELQDRLDEQEREASHRLHEELPGRLYPIWCEYRELVDKDAQYVHILDKILPKVQRELAIRRGNPPEIRKGRTLDEEVASIAIEGLAQAQRLAATCRQAWPHLSGLHVESLNNLIAAMREAPRWYGDAP